MDWVTILPLLCIGTAASLVALFYVALVSMWRRQQESAIEQKQRETEELRRRQAAADGSADQHE